MFVRVFLSLLAACLVADPTLSDERERVCTISITNETPNFKVIPTIEIFGKTAKPFVEKSPGNFEYKFKLLEEGWFNPADIKLVWKDADQKNDGTKSDFTQRVVLRLRNTFPPDFTVRVFFSNDRSQKEMSRLEHQKDDNDQWENFFRGWQIAAYYRETLAAEHPLCRRASWIFFNAADQLAERKDYIVEMSEDAIAFEKEAFKNKDVSGVINRAKSAYWEDLERIHKEIDCTTARMLLTDLKNAKRKEPDLFKLRYPDVPNKLEDAEEYVESKCPQAEIERP